MSHPTARNKIPLPDLGDGPADLPAVWTAAAVVMDKFAQYDQGTLAQRPVSTPANPGIIGRRYFATDDHTAGPDGTEYLDIGTAWVLSPGNVPNLGVTNGKLADDSVDERVLAPNSVGSAEIIDGSVGNGEIAPGAVDGGKVAGSLKPSVSAGAATEALRALGTGAGLALPGNDPSVTNARTPTVHHATHQPGGSDAIDFTTVHVADLYANRPAATAALNGVLFFATDKMMVWQCVAAAWVLRHVFAPEVTSLPASPVDQQEIIYLADTTNGIKWHFRYRAASASSFKWEYIGGSELTALVQTAESANVAAYGNLTTVGPSLTAPLAGDYRVAHGAVTTSGTADLAAQSIAVGATAASDNDRIVSQNQNVNQGGYEYEVTKTGVAAAAALAAKYRTGGAQTGTWLQRWLRIRPIRVG